MSAPVKTPLGQDEMRHRTRGLGQRYRTVLLLVDGRRPLGEVLAMALQAGAQTSHFEELVRLGLVELPREAAAPEPLETLPGMLDTPRLTSVELEVNLGDEVPTQAGDLPALAAEFRTRLAEIVPLPEPVQSVDLELDLDLALPAAPTVPVAPLPPEAPPRAAAPRPVAPTLPYPYAERRVSTAVAPPSKDRRASPPASAAMATSFPPTLSAAPLQAVSPGDGPAAAPPLEAEVPSATSATVLAKLAELMMVGPQVPPPPPPEAAPRRRRTDFPPGEAPAPAGPVINPSPQRRAWEQVRETPFRVADHARPAPHVAELELLQMVRELLLDTLRRDTLLFGTFAAGRVRAAQTHGELIKLTWEIERDRAHSRRSRDQLLNLQRARELLGMGNTLVAWDSQPSLPDDDA